MDHVPVSIVIPAFNEAHRLPSSLPRLTAAAQRIADAELIVVDDGSTDGTADIAQRLLTGIPGAQVLRLPWNTGKGTAIRVGVSYARGEAVVFMDADMASDLDDLPVLLESLAHAEVVLGSRRLDGGAVRTAGRRLGSWAFNQVTRTLTSLDVADTQCGFKAFRRDEAKVLFALARSTGFGFDVEVLALARSLGYRVVEVPVHWSEVPGGSFRVTRHTPAMLVDVVRSRRYGRRTRSVQSVPPTRIAPASVPAAGFAGPPTPVGTVRLHPSLAPPTPRVPPPAHPPSRPTPPSRLPAGGAGLPASVGAGTQASTTSGGPASGVPVEHPGSYPSPGGVV